jgi:hypothetical protein
MMWVMHISSSEMWVMHISSSDPCLLPTSILAVITVGLTLWRIEYALSLIIPALQKYGFGYLLPWP